MAAGPARAAVRRCGGIIACALAEGRWPLKGRFVVFEGIEGCGKGTQARLLFDELRRRGFDAVLTFEPGGTPLGMAVREILLRRTDLEMGPLAEAFLFCAARAQLVADVIRPALDRGAWVVCDRFAPSTAVYQGYAGGVGMELAEQLSRAATGGLRPDAVFVLDLPAEEGLRRAGAEKDRFQSRGVDFHEKVRQGYLEYARLNSDICHVLDARLPAREIHMEVLRRLGLLQAE